MHAVGRVHCRQLPAPHCGRDILASHGSSAEQISLTRLVQVLLQLYTDIILYADTGCCWWGFKNKLFEQLLFQLILVYVYFKNDYFVFYRQNAMIIDWTRICRALRRPPQFQWGRRGNSTGRSGRRCILYGVGAAGLCAWATQTTELKCHSGIISTSTHGHHCTRLYRGAVAREIFAGCVRPDQLEDDIEECRARGKPWSTYHRPVDYPSLIVFPESTGDVSRVLKVCNDFLIPVVAIAGGTSLEGQILSQSGGISLDFSRMKALVEVNENDLDCTVQPGLTYLELNELLADRGVWFPLDPGPGAAIGGMCACRCSGSTAVRYGSMRDNVLSLTVVLGDGTIVKTGGRARKSSAGYDLTRLFIGSEGTLGIVTEATLKLHVIPSHSYAMKLTFSDIASAGVYDPLT